MLIHEFRRTGQTTRTLPDLTVPGKPVLVGDFNDNSDIAGGFQAATCSISESEYNARTALYSMGSTWLVWDDELPALSPPIWAGELNDPEIRADGTVILSADGWGKLGDYDAGTFLILSYSLEQWQPGDQEPLSYGGHDRIRTRIGTKRMVFRIPRRTAFKKNDAGNPSFWHNGFYRFVPGVNLRFISFDIDKSKNDPNYSIELVASTSLGALTIINSWSMGPAGPSSVSQSIASGYDCVGIRIVRSNANETKHAPKRRFVIKNVHLGAISLDETFELDEAFVELFTRLGVSTSGVAASTVSVVPFETESGTYGQIADELSMLDNWFWRIDGDDTGAKVGVAKQIGSKSWKVDRVHSPIYPLPQPRWSHVRVTYRHGDSEVIYSKEVESSPNPFPPGYKKVYVLDWDEPPRESVATVFAQKVANYLSQKRDAGSAAFSYVKDPDDADTEKKGTLVAPGDKLILVNYGNKEVIVSDLNHEPDGSITHTRFAVGQPLLEKWLARRKRLLNRGMGPDRATLGVLDQEEPAAPGNPTMVFHQAETRKGRPIWHGEMTCPVVTQDIDGNGVAIRSVQFWIRPLDNTDTPIPKNQGGGWRKHRNRFTKDTDSDSVDDPWTTLFKRLDNPHKWKWEGKTRVENPDGEQSEWSTTVNFGKPAAATIEQPINVRIFDKSTNRCVCDWEAANDPDDSTELHPSISHFRVEWYMGATWATATLYRVHRKVQNTKDSLRVADADQGNKFYAVVKSVNAFGTKTVGIGATLAGNSNPATDPEGVTVGKAASRIRWTWTVRGRMRDIPESETNDIDVEEACTFFKLRARLKAAITGAGLTIKLYKNNTTLIATVVIAAGTKRIADDTFSVALADGDSVSPEVIVGGGATFPGRHLTIRAVADPA